MLWSFQVYFHTMVYILPHINTHTHLTALFPGLPRWAGTRKIKPIWILLKQETVSGSSISWAICKSAPRSRQITTPAPHHSVFYRPDALPATQPTASKHWRHIHTTTIPKYNHSTKAIQSLTFRWFSAEHHCLKSHLALRLSAHDSAGLYHTVTVRHLYVSAWHNYTHKQSNINVTILPNHWTFWYFVTQRSSQGLQTE